MKADIESTPPRSRAYKLNMDILRPGDVVLTRSPGQPVSEAIRLVTGADFSHAILVLALPYALESAKYGVTKFQVDRMALISPENATLLRLKREVAANVDIQRVVDFAESQVTSPYAQTEVLASLFRSLPRIESGTFFCSQLVAEAYRAGGLASIDNLAPERTTPADLANSDLFDRVVDFTYECTPDDMAFEHHLLDAPSPPSFAELENEVKQDVMNVVRPQLMHHGLRASNFNDAILELAQFLNERELEARELDAFFSSVIRAKGLPSLSRKLIPPDSDSLFLDYHLRNLLVGGRLSDRQLLTLLSHYELMEERLSASNLERDRDVTVFRKAYLYSDLETIRLVLAATAEAFHVSLRIAQVNARCLAMVREALAPTQGVA